MNSLILLEEIGTKTAKNEQRSLTDSGTGDEHVWLVFGGDDDVTKELGGVDA
jgi:hypothetical protein